MTIQGSRTQKTSSRELRWAVGLVATSMAMVIGVGGCSSAPPTVSQTTTAQEGGSASPVPVTGQGGALLASGFGQDGEYAWATSLVKNTTDEVGQTVTVQFNLLDAGGAVVASQSQVEFFTTPQQELAVGNQVTVPGKAKIAKVEATLLVEDSGVGGHEPKPAVPTSAVKVTKKQYDSAYTATYDVMNPTDQPLKNPRIGVICYNDAKQIVGGGSSFPTLVPAAGKLVQATSVITNGKPSSCAAYGAAGFL